MAVRHDHRGPPSGARLNLYIDSSAWVKLFITEPGEDEAENLWEQADQAFCVTAGYLEVRSVIARRLRGRRSVLARRLLDDLWRDVETLSVDDRLIELATRAVEAHRLRTFDALHLAAAVDLADPNLVVASWDGELRRAAEAEGLGVAPTE